MQTANELARDDATATPEQDLTLKELYAYFLVFIAKPTDGHN